MVLSASPVHGQTLRGTILDAITGEPVVLAQVSLLEEGRQEVAADLADFGGGFDLEAPRRGAYFLLVRRGGYETLLDGLFELGSDGVVEVRVGLTPEPIELDPLEVDATRPLTGPDVMQNPSIFMRRGTEPCFPTLYIDRHIVANGALDAVRPDDWVNTSEIEAIEIYARASQVPPDFDAVNDCGVVLIWTRAR